MEFRKPVKAEFSESDGSVKIILASMLFLLIMISGFAHNKKRDQKQGKCQILLSLVRLFPVIIAQISMIHKVAFPVFSSPETKIRERLWQKNCGIKDSKVKMIATYIRLQIKCIEYIPFEAKMDYFKKNPNCYLNTVSWE